MLPMVSGVLPHPLSRSDAVPRGGSSDTRRLAVNPFTSSRVSTVSAQRQPQTLATSPAPCPPGA